MGNNKKYSWNVCLEVTLPTFIQHNIVNVYKHLVCLYVKLTLSGDVLRRNWWKAKIYNNCKNNNTKKEQNSTKTFYVRQRMKLHISNTMWLKSKRRAKQTEICMTVYIYVCVFVLPVGGGVGQGGMQIIVDSSTVRLCTQRHPHRHILTYKYIHICMSLPQCALS